MAAKRMLESTPGPVLEPGRARRITPLDWPLSAASSGLRCGFNFRVARHRSERSMIEKRPITLIAANQRCYLSLCGRVCECKYGNHIRVHVSLNSGRGPRGLSVSGSP